MNEPDNLNCQREYWDSVVPTKTFTNQIPYPQWEQWVKKSDRILDYGCGYGRTCTELYDNGYTNICGVDISSGMIERGLKTDSRLDLRVQEEGVLPFEDASFDVVTLIAVLTCVPPNSGQERIIAEIKRVLKPGGILYVSDYMLQPDERNQTRYKLFAEKYGTFGIFELPEGAVVRHHSPDWFEQLFSSFTLLYRNSVLWKTMNGHGAQIEQRIYRFPECQRSSTVNVAQ